MAVLRAHAKVSIVFLIIAGLLIYHLGIGREATGRNIHGGPSTSPREATKGNGPRNSTLGFQKIFLLNLPQRTDRRDMMTLMSARLNLDVEVIASVNGTSISDKAMPYDVKNPPKHIQSPPHVGCWRSHANVWSHIISSGISSALILEDDADFSVGVRDILEGVSTQLQEMLGNRESYGLADGNSWDILGVGHCHHRLPNPRTNPKAASMFRSWVDPYAPERVHLAERFLPDAESNRVRVLAPAREMRCTHAYAVTREGAMRLLYNIGSPRYILDREVDWVLQSLLIDGLLKAYVTIPTIFGQWGYGDWRASDVQSGFLKNVGSSPDIVLSVRTELAKALGVRNVWEEYERDETETNI